MFTEDAVSQKMPDSGSLCWCLKCGYSFQAWPRQDYCLAHKPRWRCIDGLWVEVKVSEMKSEDQRL
jgi:hypothetical protein